jgi:hypothetical protein
MAHVVCRLHLLLYTWICLVMMLTRNAFHCMSWVVKCDGHVVRVYCAYRDKWSRFICYVWIVKVNILCGVLDGVL